MATTTPASVISTLSTPFAVDQQALSRRSQLLDAMQAQLLQSKPGFTANGRYYGPQLGDALGDIAEGYVIGKKRDQLQSDQKDLTTKYLEGKNSAVQSLVAAMSGQGGQGSDPRAAAFAAATSPYPEVAKIGQSYLSAGLKAVAPGEITIDQFGNIRSPVSQGGANGAPGAPAYETVNIGGDLYQKTATGLKKLDNAPKINVAVHTPVQFGQKAGAEQYFKNAANKVDELGKAASTASDIKQTVADMQALDAKGVFSNVTSGPVTFLTNLGQAVGVPVDASKLGNTEAYRALSTDLWQKMVAKMGGNRGVTAEEAAQIKQMVPLAAQSPQARAQLYTIMNGIADRQIAQYHNADKAFAASTAAEDPRIFQQGFGNTYTPQPQAPATVVPPAAPASPMSLDDYLKKHGGQ